MTEQSHSSTLKRPQQALARLGTLTKPWTPGGGQRFATTVSVLFLTLFLCTLAGVVAAVIAITQSTSPSNALIIVCALLCTTLVLTACLYVTIKKHLLAPMNALYAWALKMCDGDLSARMPSGQPAQFNKLSFHVNRLSEALERLATEMDEIVGKQTESLRQKNESLETLHTLSQALNAPGNISELLERATQTLMTMLRADSACIEMTDADAGTKRNLSRDIKAGEARPLQTTPLTIVLRYGEQNFGQIVLNVATQELKPDTEKLLDNIGQQIGMAIAKIHLENEAHQLSLIRERSALAHELHDSLAQTLAGLRFQVRNLTETLSHTEHGGARREIHRIQGSVDEAHAELRELIANFRAPVDDRGLIPAIRGLAARFQAQSGVATYVHTERDHISLAPSRELQVLRIVREALANVQKHADAKTVRVLLQAPSSSRFCILVEDDGVGLSNDAVVDDTTAEHLGLCIMRERAQALGGDLQFESDPGEGTRVVLAFGQDDGQHTVPQPLVH